MFVSPDLYRPRFEGEHSTMTASELVLDVAHVRELELQIEASGTSLFELMKRAGSALAQAAKNHCEKAGITITPRAVIFCGKGNNGGDGWVAARDLAEAGWETVIVSTTNAEDIQAQPAHDAAMECALYAGKIIIDPTEERLLAETSQADVIIDAILGTGFTGSAIKSPFDTWIKTCNSLRERAKSQRPWMIAADIPSGMNAQTGGVSQPCFKADETITMICLKPGLVTPYAFAFSGKVTVGELIDITPFLTEESMDSRPQTNIPGHSAVAEKPVKPRGVNEFYRAANEDDDGYDPYSDRRPKPEPLFSADPWN